MQIEFYPIEREDTLISPKNRAVEGKGSGGWIGGRPRRRCRRGRVPWGAPLISS